MHSTIPMGRNDESEGREMREIKFRAWTDNGMVYDWMRVNHQDEQVIDDITLPSYCTQSVMPSAAMSVMQYTGLKDKNGTEIYEGDILQHITTGESGEIKYGDGRFYCDQLNLSAYSLLNINNSRVIGNIHENKELLND